MDRYLNVTEARRELLDCLQHAVDAEPDNQAVFARLEMYVGCLHLCGARYHIVDEADYRRFAAEIGKLAHIFVMRGVLAGALSACVDSCCWFFVKPADRPLDILACSELYGCRLADQIRECGNGIACGRIRDCNRHPVGANENR